MSFEIQHSCIYSLAKRRQTFEKADMLLKATNIPNTRGNTPSNIIVISRATSHMHESNLIEMENITSPSMNDSRQGDAQCFTFTDSPALKALMIIS